MPWYAPGAGQHPHWANPGSALEKSFRAMGWVETSGEIPTPGVPPDPAASYRAVTQVNGKKPNSSGAVALAAGDVGALDEAASNARYATSAALSRTPATVCTVPTPDGDPNVTHPSVLDFGDGVRWNGYRYWMAYTPFPSDPRENPCVVASNDGVDWETPAGLTNPIAPLAEVESYGKGFSASSDTELVMLPDGVTMACYWRPKGTQDSLYRKTSTNGTTWSAAQECMLAPTNTILSPTIVIEADGTHRLWTVNDTTQKVETRTSADGITFGAATVCTVPTGLPRAWHLQVRKVDGTYYMLYNSHQGVALYYLTSPDGVTWSGRLARALPALIGETDHYRSTFVPRGGDPLRWDVWVATKAFSPSHVWRIVLLRDVDLSVGLPRDSHTAQGLFIPASAFTARVGTPSLNELNFRYAAWLLDAVAVESVKANVSVPWSNVRAEIVWANPAAGTGDVVWQVIYHSAPLGGDTSSVDFDMYGGFVTTAVPAQNVMTTTQTPTVGPLSYPHLTNIQVQRRGTDAADTLANDAAFLGLLLTPGDKP